MLSVTVGLRRRWVNKGHSFSEACYKGCVRTTAGIGFSLQGEGIERSQWLGPVCREKGWPTWQKTTIVGSRKRPTRGNPAVEDHSSLKNSPAPASDPLI